MTKDVKDSFNLSGKKALITGAAGLLGIEHARAIAELGGALILLDLETKRVTLEQRASEIRADYNVDCRISCCDISNEDSVRSVSGDVISSGETIHILVNNAARDPKVSGPTVKQGNKSRLEDFPLIDWQQDLQIGLTGAFLMSKYFGQEMARRHEGVILNIGSDLGSIGPDQRIYRVEGLTDDQQPVKPVSYSVVKAGLVGLTRYLATYWGREGVRVNLLAPGGVRVDQDDLFVSRLSQLIPLGRMAEVGEYKAAVAFLVSNASAYMTGAIISLDGGRTAW